MKEEFRCDAVFIRERVAAWITSLVPQQQVVFSASPTETPILFCELNAMQVTKNPPNLFYFDGPNAVD